MPRRPSANAVQPVDPGQAAVEFINCLTHTGDYNGEPFRLRDWQDQFIRRLLGTVRPDSRRRYRRAFLGIPRKNGKTELAAALVLQQLLGTGKRDQQIYSASGDREQASLIYRAAASMVRNDERLSSLCMLYDSYKRIELKPSNSFYQALSSEAKLKHGLRPSVVIFDELHVLPNRELFNALTTGFGATIEPLTLMITTAGWDQTSLCYEQWQYAEGVRDGLIDDPTFLTAIYAADQADDWGDEATWRKAMPALGDFCSLEFIQDEYKRAKQLPAYENTFKQLYLNLWTEQAERWITTESWLACGQWVDPAEMEGKPCYGGLDLGITGDMAVYVLIFPDEEGGLDVLVHGWVPEAGKWRNEPRNRERYEAWNHQGYLTFTEGDVFDDSVAESMILRWSDKYPVRQITGDRAYATSLLNRLFNLYGLPVKGIPQSAVHLNEAMVRLEELVIGQMIRHGGNPLLNWAVQNAVIRRNSSNLMFLDKAQARERIDALSALINAIAGMILDPNASTGRSVYETRGIIAL